MTDYSNLKPLLALALTLTAFTAARYLSSRSSEHPLASPVLVSVVAIIAFLSITGKPYESYFAGAQSIHFLLGPAVVALAMPLCQNPGRIRRSAFPVLVAILVGSASGALSMVVIGWACGVHRNNSPPHS